jgi:hypothetical protein
MSDTIIDLHVTKAFTDEHLDIVKEVHRNHWVKFYPELFGDKLPAAIKFSHFEIVPNIIKYGAQVHRVGGRNAKYKDVQQNIERNGFKLKYPPISLFRWSFDADGLEVITGNTRGEILANSGVTNFIAAVYVRNPGHSDNQVRDALNICGQRFNAIHDPAAPLTKEDVKRAVMASIALFQKSAGEAGIPATQSEIEKRVDLICGEGIFQPKTRAELVFEIYNNYNPHDIVISWTEAKNAKYRIGTFMAANKFIDTDKVRYMYTTFDTVSKAFTRACKIAAEYPEAEVRILIHTSTLSGYDLEKTYKNRIRQFAASFDKIIGEVSGASDKGASFKRLKVYAALPALGAHHNLDIPFYINTKKGKAYQKDDDVQSFDLVEEDVNLDEYFEMDDAE